MNTIKYTILFIYILLLSACTTIGSDMNTWIGAPIDEFVLLAGPPNSTFKLKDGRTISKWNSACGITLVSKNRIIQKWSLSNCLGIHPMIGQWSRPEKK